MAEVENMETVSEAVAEKPETEDAGTLEASIEAELGEIVKQDDEKPKVVPKLQVLEDKIIKPASPVTQNPVEIALIQLQETPIGVRGRPKKTNPSDESSNGSGQLFQSRNKLRRTFVTSEELDKELEATMQELEPGSSGAVHVVTNNGNKGASVKIKDQDLIAILEGNDSAEVVTHVEKKAGAVILDVLEPPQATHPDPEDEAEIALQQMMSLPKPKRGRKSKHETTTDLVSSIVDDWSDNEVEFEVTADSKSNNTTTYTVSPVSRVNKPAVQPATKSGAAKRKQTQAVVSDDAGSVEIIQTVEPPRILNAAKVTSPIKFERRRVIKKKVIWDPDDPTPPVGTRIGNTTIKKVTNVVKTENEDESPAITEEKKPVVVAVNKKKRTGKSEIDKLLGDEGAVNMLYSVERENNSDLPEIKTAMEEQLIDVEEEQNNLLKKANALKRAVIKQTKSPPTTTPSRAARAKRAPTPTPSPPTTSATPSATATATNASSAAAKKQTPAKKRKTNQNDSWDYVYKARQNDDSMIVRRRSNSSYSSTTSPRRLSLDQSQLDDSQDAPETETSTSEVPETTTETATKANPPPTKKPRGKNFEFAKPNAKKSANKKPLDTSKLVEQIRGKLKPKPFNLTPIKPVVPQVLSPDKRKALDSKQLSIKKYDKFAILTLPSIDGKVKDCLTLQLLNKIIAALKQLENDTLCNAVVITSAGTDFCRGINYNILVQIDEEKRSNAAREFASAVRKFIFALATFPKPLICSLQSGEACGIGVTILPLFDIVLARDDVKLSAPYGLMGYFPEGLSVLRLLNKIKNRTVSDLFYCNRSLTAEEGIEHELVTRTFSRSNFNDEVLSTARAVVASSTQALLSIKATLTKDLIEQIDEALAEEEQILIQHWTSAECQEKFRNFLINGHW
ncbi:uncharacterized protein LOC134831170 [Culicoides brevitarsis]|uniref:uncharacterized protein LOC134831170 n=1 Tax=Culicoides brevitarsis TaxID=469753 RepID=UPI00307B61E7